MTAASKSMILKGGTGADAGLSDVYAGWRAWSGLPNPLILKGGTGAARTATAP